MSRPRESTSDSDSDVVDFGEHPILASLLAKKRKMDGDSGARRLNSDYGLASKLAANDATRCEEVGQNVERAKPRRNRTVANFQLNLSRRLVYRDGREDESFYTAGRYGPPLDSAWPEPEPVKTVCRKTARKSAVESVASPRPVGLSRHFDRLVDDESSINDTDEAEEDPAGGSSSLKHEPHRRHHASSTSLPAVNNDDNTATTATMDDASSSHNCWSSPPDICGVGADEEEDDDDDEKMDTGEDVLSDDASDDNDEECDSFVDDRRRRRLSEMPGRPFTPLFGRRNPWWHGETEEEADSNLPRQDDWPAYRRPLPTSYSLHFYRGQCAAEREFAAAHCRQRQKQQQQQQQRDDDEFEPGVSPSSSHFKRCSSPECKREAARLVCGYGRRKSPSSSSSSSASSSPLTTTSSSPSRRQGGGETNERGDEDAATAAATDPKLKSPPALVHQEEGERAQSIDRRGERDSSPCAADSPTATAAEAPQEMVSTSTSTSSQTSNAQSHRTRRQLPEPPVHVVVAAAVAAAAAAGAAESPPPRLTRPIQLGLLAFNDPTTLGESCGGPLAAAGASPSRFCQPLRRPLHSPPLVPVVTPHGGSLHAFGRRLPSIPSTPSTGLVVQRSQQSQQHPFGGGDEKPRMRAGCSTHQTDGGAGDPHHICFGMERSATQPQELHMLDDDDDFRLGAGNNNNNNNNNFVNYNSHEQRQQSYGGNNYRAKACAAPSSAVANDDSSGVSSCCTSGGNVAAPNNRATHRVESAFHPRHIGELTLERGDPVLVEQIDTDHWCDGVNLRTGERGIFPRACVCETDVLDEICGAVLPPQPKPSAAGVERDTFYLTMLASIEVAHHKGNDVLLQAMNKVLELYKSKEELIVPQTVLMEVSHRGIHIIDKKKKNFFRCPSFDFFYSLQNISFCGAHPKQLRYLGFITKHPILPRFACHVFLSSDSTQPIVEAIGRAFRRSYDEYMAFAHPTEDIYIE